MSHKKPTKQSSTGWGGVSSRAVDGHFCGWWACKTTTHSKSKKNNWWYVDLQKPHRVHLVLVHNRLDACCASRLNGAQVYVDRYRCGTIKYKKGVSVYPINCGGRKGRFVKIVHKSNYLQLVEVQVLGIPASK